LAIFELTLRICFLKQIISFYNYCLKPFRLGWRAGLNACSKRAEVTVPSPDDWEKEWDKNSQCNKQPRLFPVATQDEFRAKVRHPFALVTVAVPANAFSEDFQRVCWKMISLRTQGKMVAR
jgi:hypothetical protein